MVVGARERAEALAVEGTCIQTEASLHPAIISSANAGREFWQPNGSADLMAFRNLRSWLIYFEVNYLSRLVLLRSDTHN